MGYLISNETTYNPHFMVFKFYFEKGGYIGHYTVPSPALSQNYIGTDVDIDIIVQES